MSKPRFAAVFVSLSAAALIGVGVWQIGNDSRLVAEPPDAIEGEGAAPVEAIAEVALTVDEPSIDPPPPNSMQTRLLTTTEGNRINILSLTMTSAGYECPEIRTARLVGNDGSKWRVQCGESRVYSIEVDEFGRLSVFPLPYGDFRGSEVQIRREGESGGRTIILPPRE